MVQTAEYQPASPVQEETFTVDDYRRQMTQAQSLLQSLMSAKAECESHQAKFNRPDMFRAVTGRSALDATIVQTRRIIDRLDAALARAEQRVEVKVASGSTRRGGRMA